MLSAVPRIEKHGRVIKILCKTHCNVAQSQRIIKRLAHTKGYQAMGSFHSENVDELVARSDESYVQPQLPFDPKVMGPEDSPFLLDRKQWTFLNHGAFGGALRTGYTRAEQWRLHLEKQPLRYFDRDLLPHLAYSARRLAEFCRAPREATTIIPNVTYGLNTILRGYTRTYQGESHIILWDTSYGSLKKMAHQLCSRVTEIPVSRYFQHVAEFEDPNEIFTAAIEDTLLECQINAEDLNNSLLVLDHTTSNTAVNMPLESLSKWGKERDMLVMVDGAHGLLTQTVELDSLPDIDFYLANGHKWLSCPRGVGMLYCSRLDFHDTILEEPAVMSHGIGQGLQSRFLWDGCRDYGAALSVPAVLDFWEGEQLVQVRHTIRQKLNEAVATLGTIWHGQDEDVTLVPMELHSPMMALVRLPNNLQGYPSSSDDAKRIQDYLYDQFVEVPIKCIDGILYVRISCHIYNELEEYHSLGQILDKYNP